MRGAFEEDRAPSAARGLAIGAVALAALIGVGAFFFIGRDGPAEPVSARSNAADPVATGTVTPAQGPSETAAVAPPTGGRMLRGVPDVIDTATLSLDGEVVRLFGVEWAPGGGKPDDLTQYLRGREVSCEQVKSGDTYRCQVDGQDLSRVVLFNGGGKTTAEATPELKATEEKARTAQTGVWSRQP
jgi:endonuclease YncB( thermonuclease family)